MNISEGKQTLQIFLEGNGITRNQALVRTAYLLTECSDNAINILCSIPEMVAQITEVSRLIETSPSFRRDTSKLCESAPLWMQRAANNINTWAPSLVETAQVPSTPQNAQPNNNSKPAFDIALSVLSKIALVLGVTGGGYSLYKAYQNKQMNRAFSYEGTQAKQLLRDISVNLLKTLKTIRSEERADAIERGLANAGIIYFMVNGRWIHLKDFASLNAAAKGYSGVTALKLNFANTKV